MRTRRRTTHGGCPAAGSAGVGLWCGEAVRAGCPMSVGLVGWDRLLACPSPDRLKACPTKHSWGPRERLGRRVPVCSDRGVIPLGRRPGELPPSGTVVKSFRSQVEDNRGSSRNAERQSSGPGGKPPVVEADCSVVVAKSRLSPHFAAAATSGLVARCRTVSGLTSRPRRSPCRSSDWQSRSTGHQR